MTPAESSTFAARFLKVKTPEDFDHLQQSLDRLFNNGILTVAEYSRLDVKMMIERAKLFS
jgi:hypothetical protein